MADFLQDGCLVTRGQTSWQYKLESTKLDKMIPGFWLFCLPESRTTAMGNTGKCHSPPLHTFPCSLTPSCQMTETWEWKGGSQNPSQEHTFRDTDSLGVDDWALRMAVRSSQPGALSVPLINLYEVSLAKVMEITLRFGRKKPKITNSYVLSVQCHALTLKEQMLWTPASLSFLLFLSPVSFFKNECKTT